MASQRLYGSIEVAKSVGISLRQLYYWVDVLRAVTPRQRQHGTRQFRRFTAGDLKMLKHVKRLVDRGYVPRAAVRIVNNRP